MRHTCYMGLPTGVCCAEASEDICNGENKHTPDFYTDFVALTITPLQRGQLVAGILRLGGIEYLLHRHTDSSGSRELVLIQPERQTKFMCPR